MKLGIRLGLAALAVAAVGALAVTQTTAKEEDKVVIAGELMNPRGLTLGPDGMLYVAEAGNGGDIDLGEAGNAGLSGQITKIDPATGTKTVVADNLPSNVLDATINDGVGPSDVAFIGSKLYYLQTHGGEAYGFPDTPTGIYEVKSDGTTQLVANIGDFNLANLPPSVEDGSQPDNEPGGNLYSMVVRNNAFYVVDANYNRVLRATTTGDVEIIAQFPDHPVPTGIAFRDSGGPFYVSTLGVFPFADEDGQVFSVTNSGTIAKVGGGIGSLVDIEAGPGDNLYALAFATQNPSGDPAPWNFFSGSIGKVNADGTITRVVDGLSFPGAIIFEGDTAYITNNGLSALAPGEILRIDNFSSQTIEQPTVVPTTAPPTTQDPNPTSSTSTTPTAPDASRRSRTPRRRPSPSTAPPGWPSGGRGRKGRCRCWPTPTSPEPARSSSGSSPGTPRASGCRPMSPARCSSTSASGWCARSGPPTRTPRRGSRTRSTGMWC